MGKKTRFCAYCMLYSSRSRSHNERPNQQLGQIKSFRKKYINVCGFFSSNFGYPMKCWHEFAKKEKKKK